MLQVERDNDTLYVDFIHVDGHEGYWTPRKTVCVLHITPKGSKRKSIPESLFAYDKINEKFLSEKGYFLWSYNVEQDLYYPRVFTVNTPEVVGDFSRYLGLSVCSPLDNFNKTLGRKYALTRALEAAFPDDKETRRLVWSWYITKARV